MQKAHQAGFSMIEILVALILVAIIATFVMPKLLLPTEDRELMAITRESYVLVGESMLQARNDPDYQPLTATKLTDYLTDHLMARTPGTFSPSTISGGTKATSTSYQLSNGSIITAAIVYDNGDIEIDMQIPAKNMTNATALAPSNTNNISVFSPGGTERYTTNYANSNLVTANLCSIADVATKIVGRCP